MKKKLLALCLRITTSSIKVDIVLAGLALMGVMISLPAHSMITSTYVTAPIGTTYYVDPAGSDENAGTSAATAFATIAKANSMLLSPGSSVLFKAGGIWHETISPQSGSNSGINTYGTYGTGARPRIDASDYLGGWTRNGNIWSASTVRDPLQPNFNGAAGQHQNSIESLAKTHDWFWDGSRLYVYETANPRMLVEVPVRNAAFDNGAGFSYVTISGLELRGGRLNGYKCGQSAACNHNIVDSVLAQGSWSDGVYFQQDNGVGAKNDIVRNSTVQWNGASGVKFNGIQDHNIITANTVAHNCQSFVRGSDENHYTDNIALFEPSGTQGDGTLITLNTIDACGFTGQDGGIASTGQGIHADTVTGITITYNLVRNNHGSGIYLEKTHNSTVAFNTLIDNGTDNYTANAWDRSGEGLESSNNAWFNNTVIGGWWACAINSANGGKTTGISFANMYCQTRSAGSQSLYVSKSVAPANFTLSNMGFGKPSDCYLNLRDTCYSTLAAFTAAYGSNTNSVGGDPMFTNASAGNYNLLAGSPLLKKGKAITGYTTPNIGATQVISSTPTNK